MKRFLKSADFEEQFDMNILYRGRNYYMENRILDIWYQENNVYAYIDGSEIYRVIMEIKNDEIKGLYCSCPYSEDGRYLCKHIAAALYYIKENDIPKLEGKNVKEKIEQESDLDAIYAEMKMRSKSLSNNYGFIDYYNGRYFVNLINDVDDYIIEFIDNEEYDKAFELIKFTYHFIKNTDMDGSNGEYQEAFSIISNSASKLLNDEKYFNKYLKWTEDVAEEDLLGDFSDAPLYAFILYVHDEKSAKKVIKILEDCQFLYGIFINKILDEIYLTYDYIDKDEAIKLCYQNINEYGVKEQLIEYLKEENKIDEIIKILKDDIKNNIRKDGAYEKLLKVYEENNMLDEKKKVLPEVIIETNNFARFKELKSMCENDEWEKTKKEIIAKIKPNNSSILEDIYMEEKEADKLFALIKKDPSLTKLYKYQSILKNKYSKELLNYYKPQVLEHAKRVSNREGYRSVCKFIGRMDELNDSSLFIYDMLKEMYPLYRNKRAFKEEIMDVLNSENRVKFANLIANKVME